ncbi:phosphoglycolate phosphatase-like HAD superfamily hydrolase [Pseudomonas sp. PvP001]
MSLVHVRHWVFDLDGTLTVAVHDFAAIRPPSADSARGRHSRPSGCLAGP